jgi:hypothetical protein
MAEQLPLDTDRLTIDIFNAEQRTDREGSEYLVGVVPMSAAEVVKDYADTYADSDVNAFVEQLAGQGYRLTEVINKATENPYGYSEYRQLEKIRDSAPKKDPEAPVDYLNMETQNIGEMGVLWDDVPEEDYATVTANYVDSNYAGIMTAAEETKDILTSDAAQEILQWQNNEDLDSTYVRKFTEQNLNRRGVFLGQEGFTEEYDKEFKRVVNKLMVDRTAGRHTATLRMAWDEFNEPSSALGGEVISALSPQVKFLGVGKADQLLYVTEGKFRHGLDILDAPKMSAIGLIKYGPSEFERGISERAMATKELYSAGAATGIPGLKYLGGAFGFVADVLTPDLTVVGGAAFKGTQAAFKAGSKLNKTVRGLQDTAKGLTETDKVAKELKAIGEMFETAAKNNDRAAVVEASKRYEKLREEYPALRDGLDRGIEAYYAERTEQAVEGISKVADEAVGASDTEEALKFLQAAGEMRVKRVVSRADEATKELSRPVELRTGVRRQRADKAIFSFDTARIPRFDKDFEAVDAAEKVLVAQGEYRTTADQVREVFVDILKTREKELKEAMGVGRPDAPDLSKVFTAARKDKKALASVQDDLLMLIESRAGIGGHTAEAVNKAETKIADFFFKFEEKLITPEVKKALDAKEARDKARFIRDTQFNIDKTLKVREARKLVKDIDAELAVLRRNQQLKVRRAGKLEDELSDVELRKLLATEYGVKAGKAFRGLYNKQQKLQQLERNLMRKGERLIEAALLRKIEDAEFIAKYYKTKKGAEAVSKSLREYNRIMSELIAVRQAFKAVSQEEAVAVVSRLRLSIAGRTPTDIIPPAAKVGPDALNARVYEVYLETLYKELKEHSNRLVQVRGRVTADATAKAKARYELITQRYKDAQEAIKGYKNEIKAIRAELKTVNKQINQAERLAKKLEKARNKQRRIEATLSRAPLRETYYTKATRLEKFNEQLVEASLDSVERLHEFFYGKGKLFAALEQVGTTRAMLNFNMKITGEALQLLAGRIEAGKRVSATLLLDTSTTREIRQTDVVQELISRKPDLDPSTVPSALELLEANYGVTAKQIAEGIVNKAPVVIYDIDTKARIVLDADFVATTQLSADHTAFVQARRESPRYSLRESFEGFKEESASGAIDRALKLNEKSGRIKRALGYVRSVVIGGHVNEELINLSPPMKRMVQRIPRAISQTVGDVARLMQDGDAEAIITYLSGIKGTFSNKRQILSSGLPSVPDVYHQSLERSIIKLAQKQDGAEEAIAIRQLFDLPLNKDGRIDLELVKARYPDMYAKAEKAIIKMFKQGTRSMKAATVTAEEGVDVARQGSLAAGQLETIPMPRAIVELLDYVQPDYLKSDTLTVETITLLHVLYNSARRNNDPREAVKAMVRGIQNAYTGGANVERGRTAMHRALPIMAANTKAYAVIHEIGDFSLALTAQDYKYWRNYVNGQPVPMEWRRTKLQELIDLTGDNVIFEAIEVMGETRYLPKEAFTAMNSAIRRASDRAVFLRKKGGTEESSLVGAQFFKNIVTTAMKIRVYGAFFFRSRFGIDSLFESTSNGMQIGGMAPAALFGIRHFSQLPVMFPGVLQVSHFANRMAKWSNKMFEPEGVLDGAPEIVKAFANMVATKTSPKDVENFFQSIGDAAANKLAQFIGAGRFQLDVNKMLAGSDEIVEIGGAQYTYKALRDMLVEEGVPGGSLAANYFATNLKATFTGFGETEEAVSALSQAARIPLDEAKGLLDTVETFAESLGERERLSMFCAFVASGYKPIEAAEMVRRGLFDYQQTLSDFDYGMAIRILVPYWGFHKNNARFQLDSMFDPLTAYRAGVVRKGPEAAVALLQESLDDMYTDELGVQTNLLSDERQEAYSLYKKELLKKLGQTRFTEDQKSLVRSILLGISAGYADRGKAFGTGAEDLNLGMIKNLVGVSDALQVNPYVEGYVKPYQQGRPVLFFPTDLKSTDVAFRKQIAAPALFNYLAVPESGQAAFATHVMSLGTASALLALAGTSAIGVNDVAPAEVYLNSIPSALENVASPDFNPVINLGLKYLGAGDEAMHYPVRISESVYNLMSTLAGSEYIFEVPEQIVGDKVVRPKRYYMSAWAAATLNLAPVVPQILKEEQQLTGETVGVSGEPIFDLSLNTARLFGLQIERGDPKSVMMQLQPSGTLRTFRPQN